MSALFTGKFIPHLTMIFGRRQIVIRYGVFFSDCNETYSRIFSWTYLISFAGVDQYSSFCR